LFSHLKNDTIYLKKRKHGRINYKSNNKNNMSRYNEKVNNHLIEVGYDEQMDYIFMMIHKDDEMIYSNVEDKRVMFTEHKDFTHFYKVLEEFNLNLPWSLIKKVENQRVVAENKRIHEKVGAILDEMEDEVGYTQRNYGDEIMNLLPR
jgi:hypothetical protein